MNSRMLWYFAGSRQFGREDAIVKSLDRLVRLLIVTAVLALLAGYVILSFPARKDSLDFSQFYAAGEMIRAGLGRNLYDLSRQMQFQSALARVHTFYAHPPFEALLFAPFTFVNYQNAYALWTIFSLALLIGSAWVIDTTAQVSAAISYYLRFPADLGLALILFATFSPVTTCLLIGQDSMLLLLLYSLVYLLLKRSSDFAAGCVLACGLFKFQFVIPFVVVLLFLRKWRAITGFAIIGVFLFILSVAISGVSVLTTYPKLLFQEKIFQQLGDLAYVPNIRGFLHLILSDHAGRAFSILVGFFSLCVLWIAARTWREDRLALSFSAALLAAVLASYHLYTYDLSLLLLPISLICAELARQKRSLPGLLLGSAAVLFVPPLHLWLIVHQLYVLMFIPVAILFFVTVRLTVQESRRAAALPGSA